VRLILPCNSDPRDDSGKRPMIDDTLPKLFLNQVRRFGERVALREKEFGIWREIYSFALSYDSDRLVKRRVSNFELLWCSLGSREIPGMK